MTFPLGRAASHPSMPRRPNRTERTADPRIRIFGEWPGAAGNVWQISISSDRIHVRKLFDGRAVGAFRFAPENLDDLESAIESTKMPGRARCVRSIPLKSGGWIDVGVSPGVVMLRIRFEQGLAGEGKRHLHARIEGPALAAFALAVSEFKRSNNGGAAAL